MSWDVDPNLIQGFISEIVGSMIGAIVFLAGLLVTRGRERDRVTRELKSYWQQKKDEEKKEARREVLTLLRIPLRVTNQDQFPDYILLVALAITHHDLDFATYLAHKASQMRAVLDEMGSGQRRILANMQAIFDEVAYASTLWLRKKDWQAAQECPEGTEGTDPVP